MAEVLAGLRSAAAALRAGERLASIGIDTWGVDYGLLDSSGALLWPPWCYRDGRTCRGVERVPAAVGPDELYAINGLQFLPFNTVYQLAADQDTASWPDARTMLLLPDLIGYRLTREIGAEWTNASTTGLTDARTRAWSRELTARLAIPDALLPPLRSPGDRIGGLLPRMARDTGLAAGLPVVAVGSGAAMGVRAPVPEGATLWHLAAARRARVRRSRSARGSLRWRLRRTGCDRG